MSANKPLLPYLLQRGDKVFIAGGRLVIKPISGRPVLGNWFEDHAPGLIRDILKKTDTEAFVFESYSTGHYGNNHYNGVNLQFTSLLSCKGAYVIFNADLKRKRNSKNAKAGSPLPKGQFRVGKKTSFYKFWSKTGLELPPRLSSFHDYMGNLKQVLFAGNYMEGERLDKNSLLPLDISYSEILKAFNLLEQPDNDQTNSIQYPDKYHTTLTYKESVGTQLLHGFQAILTTGDPNYGKRLTGSAVTREKVIPINTHKRPEDQTIDEWLADHSE